MEKLTLDEIIKAVGGQLIKEGTKNCINNVVTDSRKVKSGDLFIPLIGEKFDAHEFLEDVIKKGVSAVLVSKNIEIDKFNDVNIIKVNDTKAALGALAKYYLSKMNVKTVGVTGSVGKTSTKDMIAGVLAQKFKVVKTQGNFNNDIGLPLTIFKITSKDEIAILEMGMSNLGEIKYLADIAKPDVAVISNVGVSHIENLKSRENILKAKMEITTDFTKDNVLLVNGDNDMLSTLRNQKHDFNIVYFGLDDDNDIMAFDIDELGEDGIEYKVKIDDEIINIKLDQVGIHNVYNSLAAIGIGKYFKIPLDFIVNGLSKYEKTTMRQEVITSVNGGIKILNDVYNASTNSMESALNVLKNLKCKRRVAVLGDMLELGDISIEEHKKVGKFVKKYGIDVLITRGKRAQDIALSAKEAGIIPENIFVRDTNEECMEVLKNTVLNGDAVLVKGSRGMKMEKIVEFLKELAV